MRLLFLLSLRHWTSQPVKMLLTLFSVAIGVALVISVRLVSLSTLKGFQESTESLMGSAHLSVRSSKTGFAESYLEKIEQIPGIKFAVPVIENQTYYKTTQGEQALMVFGLDLLKEGSARAYQTTQGEDFLADPLVFLNQADSIVVTESFANENNLKIESPFSLNTPNGTVQLTVRGIIKAEGAGKAFGGSLAIMDIDGARMKFHKLNKIDRIDIILTQKEHIEKIQNEVQSLLGENFKVEAFDGQVNQSVQLTKAFTGLLDLIALFALSISGFLVYNTTTITLTERRKELATLISCGLKRSHAIKGFLFETFTQGFLASIIGVFIGHSLGKFMNSWASLSMSTQLLTQVRLPTIPLSFNLVLLAFILGCGVSLLAAIIPVLQATRIDPIVILKNNTQIIEDKLNWLDQLLKYSPLFAIIFFTVVKCGHIWPTFHFILLELVLFLITLLFLIPQLMMLSLKFFTQISASFSQTSLVFLAFQSVLRSRKELMISIISLTVCFSMTANIGLIQNSFYHSILGWFQRSLSADLAITQGLNVVGARVQPYNPELLNKLNEIPELKKQLSNHFLGIQINDAIYQKQTIKIKAFDKPQIDKAYHAFDLTRDNKIENAQLLFSSDHNNQNCFVSDNFSKRFKINKGDKIHLSSPQGPLELFVQGIVIDFISPIGTIYLPRTLYKKYWLDDLISFGFIFLDHPQNHSSLGSNLESTLRTAEIKKLIDQRLGADGLITTVNESFLEQVKTNLTQSFAPLQIIQWVVLFVAFLGLLNSTLIRSLNRTKEFGILKAIGMSRRQWAQLLYFETTIQSFLTAFIASIFASFILWFWLADVISHLLGWTIQPQLSFNVIFINSLAALIMGSLSSLFPIIKLRHLTTAEIIRND